MTPAVNLMVNSLAQSQVELNQSTDLSLTFDNVSTLDATGVTLTVAFNAGLQANSASFSIGSCNVTATQVDCLASRFSGQSSAALNLNVTGVATGSKNYTATLASLETDADLADNSADGSVRVTNSSQDDEGGGSFGWLFLLFLAGLLIRTRRPLV